MIKISLYYLAVIHIYILLYCTGIINSVILFALLYILSILPALTFIQQEYYPDLFKSHKSKDLFIIKQTNETFDSEKLEDVVETPKPNLFIQRWRKKFLNHPKQFPLDRLAFLQARYYVCVYGVVFPIQNSHLKQLVTKGDYRPYEEYEDDPHPKKLVNDFFQKYVHKRAVFYRSRKATIAYRKQRTAHRQMKYSSSSESDSDMDENAPDSIEDIPTVVSDEEQEMENGTSTPRRMSMWKVISQAITRRKSKRTGTGTDYKQDYS